MSDSKPNPPDAAAPHSGFSRIGWTVVMVLFLYALSPGPALKFSGRPRAAALRAFYAPLTYLSHHLPAVEKFYGWYLELWGIKLVWW